MTRGFVKLSRSIWSNVWPHSRSYSYNNGADRLSKRQRKVRLRKAGVPSWRCYFKTSCEQKSEIIPQCVRQPPFPQTLASAFWIFENPAMQTEHQIITTGLSLITLHMVQDVYCNYMEYIFFLFVNLTMEGCFARGERNVSTLTPYRLQTGEDARANLAVRGHRV